MNELLTRWCTTHRLRAQDVERGDMLVIGDHAGMVWWILSETSTGSGVGTVRFQMEVDGQVQFVIRGRHEYVTVIRPTPEGDPS